MKEQTLTPQQCSKKLREMGINPSAQRIAVYTYLCNFRNHPTAETIYNGIVADYPSLSLTTIYNTVKLFQANRVIQSIYIEDNELRYDADLSLHGHAKCNCCGEVFDVFFDQDAKVPVPGDGFEVKDIQIYYRGKCKNCQ